MLGAIVRKAAKRFGFEITRISDAADYRIPDVSPDIRGIIEQVRPYTMTSYERLAALCMAVEYVVSNNIPGVFVECGVWKGGSSMAAAMAYRRLCRDDVDLYLFDTFDGMSAPGKEDVRRATGESASDLLATKSTDSEVWARAPLEEVRENLKSTGYPIDRIHFVKGKVETTIPNCAPQQIAILRLDTDWYESTRHELTHLFPRLAGNGVLIIDDYGHWAGARKAVDEYFAALPVKPLLVRIDDTGRLCIKP
jgi:O-methyltransferase